MEITKCKRILIILVFILLISMSTSVLATNEKIQILEDSKNCYMIYLQENLKESFEFAISSNPNETKENLQFKNSATDEIGKNANYIAYIDEETYNNLQGKEIYLWARKSENDYIVEKYKIDLKSAISKSNVELVNNITKTINVETSNVETSKENVDGVIITKTVGMIEVKEEGKNYYSLIKLPNGKDYNKFIELVEKLSLSNTLNTFDKLNLTQEFVTLYEKLLPSKDSKDWIEAQENKIMQPEDSKENDKYIVFLKNENNEGNVKYDVQFLTCFEDYKQEVVSQKIESKLPITYDNPILFIILGILIIALIAVILVKYKSNKNKKDN